MFIVADESVDIGIVQLLRKKSHEVVSIAEECTGISDEEVLNIAFSKDAILITEDKDFGELAYRLQLNHCGIILIRLGDIPRNERLTIASDTIHIHKEKLINCFSVLTPKGLRIKPSNRAMHP
jgi:predicted nuclease of predicted toxin-antitoxin system